ncbi:MAG: hypothetical protein ACRDRX_04295 [Pseudonocardiaceae bacterium]
MIRLALLTGPMKGEVLAPPVLRPGATPAELLVGIADQGWHWWLLLPPAPGRSAEQARVHMTAVLARLRRDYAVALAVAPVMSSSPAAEVAQWVRADLTGRIVLAVAVRGPPVAAAGCGGPRMRGCDGRAGACVAGLRAKARRAR